MSLILPNATNSFRILIRIAHMERKRRLFFPKSQLSNPNTRTDRFIVSTVRATVPRDVSLAARPVAE